METGKKIIKAVFFGAVGCGVIFGIIAWVKSAISEKK